MNMESQMNANTSTNSNNSSSNPDNLVAIETNDGLQIVIVESMSHSRNGNGIIYKESISGNVCPNPISIEMCHALVSYTETRDRNKILYALTFDEQGKFRPIYKR